MNRKLLQLGVYAAMALMAAQGSEDVYTIDERKRKSEPKVKREPKTFDQVLSEKGLSNFVINGETIIAHNEREAQKRYRHRHKNDSHEQDT